MKGYFQLIGLGLAMVAVQGLVLESISESFYPDLVLVFALAMGLRTRGISGLLLAFGAGFLVDVGSAHAYPGLYALLRGTACAATRLFDRALYLRSGGPWVLYVGAYVFADGILLGLLLQIFTPESAISFGEILWRTPFVALLTALCAAPILGWIRRFDSVGGHETGWGLLGSRV